MRQARETHPSEPPTPALPPPIRGKGPDGTGIETLSVLAWLPTRCSEDARPGIGGPGATRPPPFFDPIEAALRPASRGVRGREPVEGLEARGPVAAVEEGNVDSTSDVTGAPSWTVPEASPLD